MRTFSIIWGALTLAAAVEAKNHVWGVKTEEHGLYQAAFEKGEFTCKDAKTTVPIAHVNDDYCDCPDGSDEPGTSACLGSQFFCPNKGFKSQIVYSSRVNDGVCDCCDGSDEWNSPASCADTCIADGHQYRVELKQKYIQLKEAVTRKQALIAEAQAVHQAKQDELELLKSQVSAAEAEIAAKTAVKTDKEAEEERVRAEKQAEWDLLEEARIAQAKAELEAQKLREAEIPGASSTNNAEGMEPSKDFQTVAVGVDGASVELTQHTLLTPEQEQLLQQQDNAAGSNRKKQHKEEDLEGNNNHGEDDDEEVMQDTAFDMNDFPHGQPPSSCVGWFQTGNCDPKATREPQFDKGCAEWVPKGASGYCQCANDIRHEYTCDHKRLRCDDVCVTMPHDSSHPLLQARKAQEAAAKAQAQAQPQTGEMDLADDGDYEDEAELLSDSPASPSATPDPLAKRDMPAYTHDDAEAARKALEEANSAKNAIESRVSKIKKDLEYPYGDNNEFLPLKDKCAGITLNKYKYELCLYGSAKQNDGHSDIRLGEYDSMERGADGLYRMHFKGGLRCWGGPDRSAILELRCGPEYRLLSADEPEKCVYHVIAEAPAACSSVAIEQVEKELRDMGEL